MANESGLTAHTRPTLIEVMAPHCVECRAMQPDLDAVAADYQGLVDLEVMDATREGERVAGLKVFGTPTFIAVNDGTEIARVTGRRSRSELQDLFTAVAAGDTTAVQSRSRDDRAVRTIAGVLLLVAGVAMGPSWVLIGIGAGLAGYANFPSGRSHG